ncbi:MAG TPA: hypothetical protein PKE12_05900 [Kiritimatiellia bacterium]|nr:hypothetical protein [Kiritimatiellia bacterium]
MSTYEILRWLHVICMAGLLGGLLLFQLGLSTASRMDAATLRGATRLWNILLGIGLLAAVLMYGMVKGHTLGGHYNGVIGLKFIVLFAVGGLLPVAKKRASGGDGLRWLCIVLLLVASLSAFTI